MLFAFSPSKRSFIRQSVHVSKTASTRESCRKHPSRPIKAECLALFEGGSRPDGGSFSSPKRKGLEERDQLGDSERAKSDPPCIIPFERHFKNGLSAARLLTSGVDA